MKIFKKLFLTAFILSLTFIMSIGGNFAYANENYVYLGGFTAGFNVNTRGVTVVGLTEVFTEKGLISPSKNAGLKVGDTIISINGEKTNSSTDVYKALKGYKSGNLITEIERNGYKVLKDIAPEKDMSGNVKIGVFLRDGITGLGTVTYVLENGNFASLGHPVTDENGKVLNVSGGSVYNCAIIGVNKAVKGKTGELKGLFSGDKKVGKITANSAVGLYGVFENIKLDKLSKIHIGSAKIGDAKIYSTVDGITPKYYDIEILKTDLRNTVTKNLVIKICDKSLIDYTGGIVQGMSGSPIIQDGKIVGAITHVFVNDSARGYGISIQNMLEG